MLCNWFGTAVYFWISGTEKQPIKRQHMLTLALFSVVFTLNIAVGNVSSFMVPVSFNQVSWDENCFMSNVYLILPIVYDARPQLSVVGTHAFRRNQLDHAGAAR